jgi:hypothetical protein
MLDLSSAEMENAKNVQPSPLLNSEPTMTDVEQGVSHALLPEESSCWRTEPVKSAQSTAELETTEEVAQQ